MGKKRFKVKEKPPDCFYRAEIDHCHITHLIPFHYDYFIGFNSLLFFPYVYADEKKAGAASFVGCGSLCFGGRRVASEPP